MSGVNSTPAVRKGWYMFFKTKRVSPIQRYLVSYCVNGEIKTQPCVGFEKAVKTYRELKGIYGYGVRLAEVIVDYGETL